MGKEKTARVWQASKMLQLEPRQLHLRTYVRGFIAHDKLRANLVKDVHLAFYDTRGERLTNKQGEVDKRSTWDTLVHRTCIAFPRPRGTG